MQECIVHNTRRPRFAHNCAILLRRTGRWLAGSALVFPGSRTLGTSDSAPPRANVASFTLWWEPDVGLEAEVLRELHGGLTLRMERTGKARPVMLRPV